MTKFTFQLDDGIPESDRSVLLKHQTAIQEALMFAPVYVARLTDSKGRSHYRILEYSDRKKCLVQFVIPDIAALDGETLKGRIIAGEFKERQLQ